jgi:hypothetical protein
MSANHKAIEVHWPPNPRAASYHTLEDPPGVTTAGDPQLHRWRNSQGGIGRRVSPQGAGVPEQAQSCPRPSALYV